MHREQIVTLSDFPWYIRGGITLFFAGIGLLLLVSASSGHPHALEVERSVHPTHAADWAVPVVFLLVGLGISLIRYRKILDADQRVVDAATGWGVWLSSTRTDLSGVTHIEIFQAVERGSRRNRRTVIPVKAVALNSRYDIGDFRTDVAARVMAERCARALNVPLVTGVGADLRKRMPADLDRSIAELEPPEHSDLQAPPHTHIVVTNHMSGVDIHLTWAIQASLFMVVKWLFYMSVFGCVWYFWWLPVHGKPSSTSTTAILTLIIPPSGFLLVSIAALVSAIRSGICGGVVRVSAVGGLRCLGHRASATRIRELRILPEFVNGGGILVIADTYEFKLARGQAPEDLRWIRALILKHVSD